MNDKFWGYACVAWIVGIIILIVFMVYLAYGIFAYGSEDPNCVDPLFWSCIQDKIPDTYKECIDSDLPEYICEYEFPPLDRESV